MLYSFHQMIQQSLKFIFAILLCAGSAQAQLSSSLKIVKKQHLTGEPVLAVVTVTNHAGRDLILQSDGRFQWLNFSVKTADGTPINLRGQALFGPIKIGVGQTMAREVDLSQHFQLNQSGNFTVSATIRLPDHQAEGTSTNRAFFNQSQASRYWSQKVGISGSSNQSREYRIFNFSGDSKPQIYAQIADGKTGQLVRTFPLGDVLMLRKPIVTVDRQQRMHVMFLATPVMWVHYVINTDAEVVSRQIHQRGPVGDPQLLVLADGSVQVTNSIPYDPVAAAEQKAKIHKASDRPKINP
jgi:hypothetical protein